MKAIETLKKRFGNKQQIQDKHMDALLHMEAVTSSHNVKALRRLFDSVSSHVRSLESLGVEPQSYGSLLCSVFISKLPEELQLVISRNVSEADWKLKSLMEAVEDEIRARERISVDKSSRQMPCKEGKIPPTATTLVSGNVQNGPAPCCYCNQSHPPVKCEVISQVEDRKQCLRKSGRCFICLRRGHMGCECHSQGRCHTCGGRHHTSICGKMMNTVEDQSSVLKTPPVNPNPPTVAVSNNPTTTGSIPNCTCVYYSTNFYLTPARLFSYRLL